MNAQSEATRLQDCADPAKLVVWFTRRGQIMEGTCLFYWITSMQSMSPN